MSVEPMAGLHLQHEVGSVGRLGHRAGTVSLAPDVVSRMVSLRRDLHEHPELAFAETRTADLVARELASLGLAVRTGIGRTGVVGTLARGPGPSIGLRADMDALAVTETTGLPHSSRTVGVMHACGHDGHIAMLLAAAHGLKGDADVRGTIHFVFQPAEEGEGGGRAMVEDGLFRNFPCDSVWGLHNWPGLRLGDLATRVGPIMASLDTFEVEVRGSGTHAAMPELGVDPIVIASEVVLAMQTIVSRRIATFAPVVVSATQIHGGDALNVIPELVIIRGTIRCLEEDVRQRVAALLETVARGVALAHGGEATVVVRSGYPATVNASEAVPIAISAAGRVASIHTRRTDLAPSMASEDFAYMLQERPGAYAWLGVDGPTPSKPLHNPGYDFNDDALPIGAAYWISLTRELLVEAERGSGT